MSLPEIVVARRVVDSTQGAAGAGEGAHPPEGLAERRPAPAAMVRMDKDYRFEGPRGEARLLDLFEGRRQLMVQHFMFDPAWDDGCPSCSADADEIAPGLLAHLHARDTTFAAVSRAPLAKLEDYRARKGWTFPWYSSYGSDFNYDFHTTIDESVAPLEFNYRDARRDRSRCERVAELDRDAGAADRDARASAASCATATASSTRTRRSAAAPRRSAAPTPTST